MRAVLDTNVLVSGLLNPHGTPGQILVAVMAERIEVVYDPRLLTEYRRVLLQREFPFEAADAEEILAVIEDTGPSVASSPLPKPLPHRADEPFLEAAIAGDAEYLVTGNIRHFPARLRQGVKVVSPAEFLDALRAEA